MDGHCSQYRYENTGLGLHVADLPTLTLKTGTEIVFTFLWMISASTGELQTSLLGLSKQAERDMFPMICRYRILELLYGGYQRCF